MVTERAWAEIVVWMCEHYPFLFLTSKRYYYTNKSNKLNSETAHVPKAESETVCSLVFGSERGALLRTKNVFVFGSTMTYWCLSPSERHTAAFIPNSKSPSQIIIFMVMI